MEPNQIKTLFSNLYGTEVDLTSPKNSDIDYVKQYFVKFVTDWRSAYKTKDTLFKKFGIAVDGYDELLYSALENLIFASLGEVKGTIVESYIYCPLNLEVEYIKYIDKHQKEYLIQTPEDLYHFVLQINDEDYLEDK